MRVALDTPEVIEMNEDDNERRDVVASLPSASAETARETEEMESEPP